jgi:hypothetical protein
MTLTLPDTTKYEINTVTQFTDEEKQAQGRAMLDEEKAEFDLLVKKVKGDIARLGGRARLLSTGINIALPIALLLLVLPFFTDLSFYWFAAATVSIVITFSYAQWTLKHLRRCGKEGNAQLQQKGDELVQKKDALKASWE